MFAPAEAAPPPVKSALARAARFELEAEVGGAELDELFGIPELEEDEEEDP